MRASSALASGSRVQNPWLDLVRALAILLVLARHGARALDPAGDSGQGILGAIAQNGWIGVDLFFVLSGYLIASHLMRAGVGTEAFHYGRYVGSRALRIVPAYLVVLALIVAGAFPFYPVDPSHLGVRVAYHLLFLQDYLPSNINVVFWSLGVEEKFYLLAPALVGMLLLPSLSNRMVAALLLALFLLPTLLRTAPYLRLEGPIGYDIFFPRFRSPFHLALEGLVVGVAVAAAERAGLATAARKRGFVLLAGSAALLFAFAASHVFMAKISLFDVALQPGLIAILAGAMVFAAVRLKATAMSCSRSVGWLARLSYALYLVHFPLIPWMLKVSGGNAALFWLAWLGVSALAALALHLVVERPFLRLKARVEMGPHAPTPLWAFGSATHPNGEG